MKKIHKIGLSCVLILSMTACKQELLNIDPQTSYTYYNFPTNEDQVSQAVVACYARARAIHNDRLWRWGEMLSDNSSFAYNAGDRGGLTEEAIDEHTYGADNGQVKSMWDDSYDGVLRSNYALANLEKISFRLAATKTVREGEAKFWRAWNLFNLVRLYGDIPVVKKVITDPTEGVSYKRLPVDEVYTGTILPDALDAVAKLPIKAEAVGRLTKGAALMLLSEIYMTRKDFKSAIPLLTEITNLGYKLNTNYADNFDPLKKNGTESILEMQSDPVQAITFGFGGTFTPFGTGTTVWLGGSNSRGGLNQPTNELNGLYEATDTRKNANIGSIDVSATRKGVLFFKKFLFWDAITKGNPVNFTTYRYSDALLMLAECLNEEAFGNAQAFALLNQVRTRAGVPAKTQGNAKPELAINNQEAFRAAIALERRLELAGENHRWFDLVRTGKAVEVLTAHGIAEKKIKTTVTTAGYTTIRTLLPIPTYETRQWGYPQNAGW
jgi:starch-binding outer membrane protein, SusD/RagB family